MGKILKKYWYLFVIAVVLFAIGARTVIQARTGSTNTDSNAATAYTVTKKNLHQTITLSGEIDADEKATLRFQTSGRLAWIGVKEGDTVKKYQALASLDQRELRKNLEKDLNTYLSTRWDFEQLHDDDHVNGQPLDALGTLSTDEKRILQKSQFGLNKTVLDVELTSLSLEYATLISPINGIVSHVNTPLPGVNITPTSAEFEVVNPESIYLSVLADQTEVTQLRDGMNVSVSMDPYPDTTISGTVRRISFVPKSGESNTVYEVHVVIPAASGSAQYRIGMTADATFIVKEKAEIISVPIKYIKTENGKKYVTKDLKGKKIKSFVTTGEEFDDDIEIRTGVFSGDVVYD